MGVAPAVAPLLGTAGAWLAVCIPLLNPGSPCCLGPFIMIARNNEEDFGEGGGLSWCLAPPSLFAAHPDFEEQLMDPEDREVLIEQFLDEKLCDRAEITVVR